MQAYLPSKDLAIAAEATVDKNAKVAVNGGQEVFEEVASELAPNHPEQTSADRGFASVVARVSLGQRGEDARHPVHLCV